MSVHPIDRATFLVEYPGLRHRAEDVSLLAGPLGVSDRAFGAELRRLLYAEMESTPEAQWVRGRGYAITVAPTEPHRGRFVFRMTFQDEDQAAMFAIAWAPVEAVPQSPVQLHSQAA